MRKDLINAGNKLLEKQNQENIWEGQPFESFHYLTADYSGKAGENAFFDFLKRTKTDGLHNWEVQYDGDSNLNTLDGTYDIAVVVGSRNSIGLKTARLDKKGTFQHDNLHDNECDCELLIDITPTTVFLTIICFNSYSLKEKHPIFERTPHLRKNTSNNYKFDLSEKNLNKGINNEVTIRLYDTTTDVEVIDFLKGFLD
jgi:hypothetical protein